MEQNSNELSGLKEHPMPGQKIYTVDFISKNGMYEGEVDETRRQTGELDVANAISSEIEDSEYHKVLLDLDIPAKLIPSSTEGHSHLYIDKEMSWDVYENLLKALAMAGVIEWGYAHASIRRKATFLRLPWIEKSKNPDILNVREFIEEN